MSGEAIDLLSNSAAGARCSQHPVNVPNDQRTSDTEDEDLLLTKPYTASNKKKRAAHSTLPWGQRALVKALQAGRRKERALWRFPSAFYNGK